MEAIEQTFSGVADFGKSVTATISRNGDLVYRMYLEHAASFKQANTSTIAIGDDYGSHVMKEMELEIGGQKIDRHYGHWHSVYSRLTEQDYSGSQHSRTLFNTMAGNGDGIETNGGNVSAIGTRGWTMVDDTVSTAKGTFWIPLYFWFCRNPGLALPLIALQYHEVKVKISFEEIGKLIAYDTDDNAAFGASTQNTNAGTATNVDAAGTSFSLWCDYIYLDTDERRRFAQVSHEYLIEQVQFESKTGGGGMNLNFNHPVKELIWAGVRNTAVNMTKDLLYRRGSVSDGTYLLKLNGHDRFKERDYRYFTRTQIWEHHTGNGGMRYSGEKDTIAVYSFALKPEEHQPSGTCNFSRIDNAQLIDSKTVDIHVYAVNYNVLRIMSGMGGLAYSN
tara:strand:- start:16 stop:1188 length:1173 start_codon:yes stop_codon:yes gene_type:complete